MISVLVADDSFFMRKLISDILSADPDIRVVGVASDGEQAIAMAGKLQPDVVTMDLDMPKVNGLDATKRIMKETGPRPIVVMLSAYTKEKANETLECMRAGAFGCVLKPSGPISLNIETVERELIAQIKAAARSRREALQRRPLRSHPAGKSTLALTGEFPLVVIGASTGGPPVLEEIFAALDRQPEVAVLVVQHMPEKFTESLAERLDKISLLKVKQGEEGEVVKPGIAYIAPGDQHMRLQKKKEGGRTDYVIRLSKDQRVKGLRPSIDVLLESVAAEFNGRVLTVILTGMGTDGAAGIRSLQQKGQRAVVQKPDTCVVDSMVQAVIEQGAADAELDSDGIARCILDFSASPAA